jgi:hypothetical protein
MYHRKADTTALTTLKGQKLFLEVISQGFDPKGIIFTFILLFQMHILFKLE